MNSAKVAIERSKGITHDKLSGQVRFQVISEANTGLWNPIWDCVRDEVMYRIYGPLWEYVNGKH